MSVNVHKFFMEGKVSQNFDLGLSFDFVTTVPLSVSYGGAKPLGPWVRTSNFVPWWVTGWSREGSTRTQKHRTVVC